MKFVEAAERWAASRIWWMYIAVLTLIGGSAYIIQVSYGLQLFQTLPGVLQGSNITYPLWLAVTILVLTSVAQYFALNGSVKFSDGLNFKEIVILIIALFVSVSEVAVNSNLPFVTDAYPSEYRGRIQFVYASLTPPDVRSHIVQRLVYDAQTKQPLSAVTGMPITIIDGIPSDKPLQVSEWRPIETQDGVPTPMTLLDKVIHVIIQVLYIGMGWAVGLATSLLPEICLVLVIALLSKRFGTREVAS